MSVFVYRAEASLPKLAELNPYVTLNHSTSPFNSSSDLSFLSSYQVRMALVNQSIAGYAVSPWSRHVTCVCSIFLSSV